MMYWLLVIDRAHRKEAQQITHVTNVRSGSTTTANNSNMFRFAAGDEALYFNKSRCFPSVGRLNGGGGGGGRDCFGGFIPK